MLSFVPDSPSAYLVAVEARGVAPKDLISKDQLHLLLNITMGNDIDEESAAHQWLRCLLSRGVELDLSDFGQMDIRLFPSLLKYPGWLEGKDGDEHRYNGIDALLRTRLAARKPMPACKVSLQRTSIIQWNILLPELVRRCIMAGVAGSRIHRLPDVLEVPNDKELQRAKRFLFAGDTWRELVRLDVTSRSVFFPELVRTLWTDITKFRQPRRAAVKKTLYERKGFPLCLAPIIVDFAGFSSGETVVKDFVEKESVNAPW